VKLSTISPCNLVAELDTLGEVIKEQ
jgi:hypothetical protein